ncbi:MAG: alpha/beta hydrolase family protein [Gemmatimonadota bacterium]
MEPPVRCDPFVFEVRDEDPIRGDVWRTEEPVRGAAIVVCHGFKGFKDWGFFPYLCRALAHRTGCPVVSFNFTGSGIGQDLQNFTELERFARNTFSRELEDLEAVLDRLSTGGLGHVRLPPAERYGLLGHSRGGATALLKAALRSQVRALVTWAAIASVGRYETVYGPELRSTGVVYIPNVRTGQQMPLRRNVLDDIRAHPDRLDLPAAASRLRVPYLIVHGEADEAVPVADARALAAAAEDARLELIAGAGHTLNVGHPFSGPSDALERAIALSADHFRAHLAEA